MKHQNNTTYRRILDASERLFSEKGYTAITLQDIAEAVNMRHASLYYYAPNGKEQLYIAVMERSFKRHNEGLTYAIIEAGEDFRAQIHAIARWFATHPPIDFGRMLRSDMPEINTADAERLTEFSLEMLRFPISAVISDAMKKDQLALQDADFAAMGLVGLLQSVHNIPKKFIPSQHELIRTAIAAADMLLDGWFKY